MKPKFREFKLTSLAVDNATSIFLITLMIMLFGIQSYQHMPKEQFPEATIPTVYVNTPYFGNSAEEIENLVSRPLEQEIEAINEIKNVTSTSIQDFSVIIAEFNTGVEMTEAVRKVKDAVDKAKSELPTDMDQEPSVLEINFSDIPIITVNVAGNHSSDELRGYAEKLEDEIERIKEVNKVDLKGAREREVRIDVDLSKMQSLQVAFSDIENAVSSENLTLSGGEIETNGFKRAVRIIGQYEDVDALRNTIVKSENLRPIYLKDIAEVTYSFEDRKSYARADGSPVISLDVIKRKGENLLSATEKIKEAVDKVRPTLPSDLSITYFNDQSVYTKTQVSNLENSIISGVLLVTLVLLFFLGLRNASFVGIAIPLSMLMGILFLDLTGTTLNVVVLFSLILALGLLVDNAIVVVENIYRYMQEGYGRIEAAKYGAGEVALPIIASTATTLGAFLPLAFWPGIMGEFMQYLPITLIIVLSSSLFVALVINPVFASVFMKVDEQAETVQGYRKRRKNVLIGAVIMFLLAVLGQLIQVDWLRNIMAIALIVSLVNFFLLRPMAFSFQNTFLPKLERWYDRFITFALRGKMPYAVFGGTVLLLIFSIVLLALRAPKLEFFPDAEPQYINVFVDLPLGSDITTTNEVVGRLEDRIYELLEGKEAAVEAVLTQIGENTADPNGEPEPGVTPNKARITVQFVPTEDRGDISSGDVLNEMRQEISGYAGVSVIVDKNADGPPAGKPINIELKGEDIDSLIVLAEHMEKYIVNQNIQGIEELIRDVELGKPELLINIDREAARRYQLSTYSIADAIRTSIYGKEVSKYKVGEDEYPIMVRLNESDRNDIGKVINQKITFRNPANGQIIQVPISSVASFQYGSTYNSIKRKDGERVITLYSNVLDGYNANEVVANIRSALASFEMPDGYVYEFTGEQEQQMADMSFLSTAFMIALFLIFIIIVTQFNSIISPFIILLSILFSTIGVFLGYFVSGDTISVIFSGVGIISLAGVVVNNAIVLIDYINVLKRNKRQELDLASDDKLDLSDVKASIIKGGTTRLRPVLLTAITTILGLIPLALGINFNFFTLITDLDPQYFQGGDNQAIWGPMAWTIIYGLTFATFLTLVVVPVMVWLSDRWKRKVIGLFSKSS